MINDIIIWILAIYFIIDIIKGLTIGHSFSIIKALKYGGDYERWYKRKFLYITLSKRKKFKNKNKGKNNE